MAVTGTSRVGSRVAAAGPVGGDRGRCDCNTATLAVGFPRVTAAVMVMLAVVVWPKYRFQPSAVEMFVRFVAALATAAVVHEVGHWVLGRVHGLDLVIRVNPLLSYVRPRHICGVDDDADEVDIDGHLSPAARLTILLAGPAANLVAAATLAGAIVMFDSHPGWAEWSRLVVGLNIFVALYNMVPVPPLDGGRALGVLVESLAPAQRWAAQWAVTLGGVMFGLAEIVGGVLRADGSGWTALAVGGGVLISTASVLWRPQGPNPGRLPSWAPAAWAAAAAGGVVFHLAARHLPAWL